MPRGIKLLAALVLAVGLLGIQIVCGGGSGGSSTLPATSAAASTSATVAGGAAKGIIQQGTVAVYELAGGSWIVRGTTTTTTTGSYTLTVSGYLGGPAKLTLTAGANTTMIWDGPTGNGHTFGVAEALPSTFTMSAVVPSLSTSSVTNIPITPYTNMADALIEASLSSATSTTIQTALNTISGMVGFNVATVQVVDVTNAAAMAAATTVQQQAAAMSAAVTLLEGTGDAATAVSQLASSVSGGQFTASSAITSANLVQAWTNALAIPGIASNMTLNAQANIEFAASQVTSGTSGGVYTPTASSGAAGASAPSIYSQTGSQTVTAPTSATFTVYANGTAPMIYQWYLGGTAIKGATSNAYSTGATTTALSGGSYTCMVTNAAGSATSTAAALTVLAGSGTAPTITTQPASQTVTAPATATFSVVATGTAPLLYQWKLAGVAITGANSASYTTGATTLAMGGGTYTCTVTNGAGSVTSNGVMLNVTNGPVITTQPVNVAVTVGQTATFSVTIAAASGSSTFQWQKNGTAISGATAYAYTTPATTLSDNGSTFTVVVTNSGGSVTSSSATLTVTAPASPTITTQPASQTVTIGQAATFTVVATGTAPLTFQWQKNGVAIAGATAASYVTPVTAATDSGSTFAVVITNAAGSVTSSGATLTVSLVPAITAQPVNLTSYVGGYPTFTVTAVGAAPLTYQWKFNNVNVSGATSASYNAGPITASSAGSYTVVVTNGSGSVTSSAALLTLDATSTLVHPRYYFTANLLGTGQVLAAGGTVNSAASATAELYNVASNSWAATGSMVTSRQDHTATVLGNGLVLAAGGDQGSAAIANAETYNASTNSWSAVPSMAAARSYHTATLLGNGKVLVAGGYGTSGYLSACELFDPATSTWSAAGSMTYARGYHMAVLLNNGLVLVAGGVANPEVSAELYNPATNTWTPTGSMANSRSYGTATLLNSGKVLVAGGDGTSGDLMACELFDPTTGTWSSAGSMAYARESHTATLLASGQVLVAGGTGPNSPYATAELYSPTTNTWAAALPLALGRFGHTATLLSNATILLTGGEDGSSSSEVYSPVATPTTAPAITTGPVSQSVTAGQTATFTVVATGTAPLTYQWMKNGTAITGATSTSYTTPAEVVGDNGAAFTVVVTNSVSSVTSSSATLTVTAAAGVPVISSFLASPSSIPATTSSILSWIVTGATSLSINNSVGTVTGASGSQNVSPATTTTYTLTATNATGSVTATATVTVTAPVISSFSATPSAIASGASSTLAWTVNGATTLSINQSVGTVTGTSKAVTPTATTTYTLTATNGIGSTTATATVTVSAGATTGVLQNTIPIWNTTNYLASATATLIKTGQTNVVATSNSNGFYTLTAPAATGYGMTVAATGYMTQTWSNVAVTANATTSLPNVAMLPTSVSTGSGNASGNLSDAMTGSPLTSATIKLCSGLLNYNGTVVTSTTTDSSGDFTFVGLAPGYYTAYTALSGYQSGYFMVVIAGGYATTELNYSISPTLSLGEIRIVTTWGATPLDLDNHLTGPSALGGTFHIYFGDLMDSSLGGIVYADLDHDVTDGFGPETDTIHTALSGTYQFLVNDYTDEFTASLGSSPLAASGATVNVYTSAGLMATFYVPNLPGTLWYVFDLDGASLTLTPVNTMSFDQPDAYPSVLPVVAATRGGLVSAPAEASEVAATRAVAPRVPKAAARKAVNVKPAFIMP